MKRLFLALALLPAVAFAQQTPNLSDEQLAALIAKASAPNSGAMPASCDSPMALSQMMEAIQQDVGDRIGDQLVDIRNPHTLYIKPDGYSCRIVTVWGQGKAVEGIFKLYRNAVGRIVYSWNGQRTVTAP